MCKVDTRRYYRDKFDQDQLIKKIKLSGLLSFHFLDCRAQCFCFIFYVIFFVVALFFFSKNKKISIWKYCFSYQMSFSCSAPGLAFLRVERDMLKSAVNIP